MMQAADDYNIDDVLNRYEILRKMWLLEGIKCELEDTIGKIDSKELHEPALVANYAQMQIMLQILGIIIEDADSLVRA